MFRTSYVTLQAYSVTKSTASKSDRVVDHADTLHSCFDKLTQRDVGRSVSLLMQHCNSVKWTEDIQMSK